MKRIGVIINPYAKKNKKNPDNLKNVYSKIDSEIIDLRFISPSADSDSIIKDFLKAGHEIIAISGGDGTIHCVLTSILQQYPHGSLPELIIIPGGTMDNISRSLKQDKNGPRLLKHLCNKIRNEAQYETVSRDTIKIDNKYCFLFGAGMVTNFLEQVYAGGKKGNLKNLQVMFKALVNGLRDPENSDLFKGLKGECRIDRIILPLKHIRAILAGTVPDIGMGFRPMPMSIREEGCFQVIVSDLSPVKIFKNVLNIRYGREIREDNHFSSLARSLVLKSDGKISYTMDGDLYEAENNLKISIGPSIKLVRG